jgi:hypothetical protein
MVMKYNVKITLLTLGIFALAIAGCKRQPCFNCYILDGGFQCSKNGYTYVSPLISNRKWLQDSVTLYISRGYSMDTVFGFYRNVGIICDTPQVLDPFPDSCIFSYYKQ